MLGKVADSAAQCEIRLTIALLLSKEAYLAQEVLIYCRASSLGNLNVSTALIGYQDGYMFRKNRTVALWKNHDGAPRTPAAVILSVADKDASHRALKQVEKATDSDRAKGEDLLGSEDLKRQVRAAKECVRREDAEASPIEAGPTDFN